jgi:hypothetical protein
MNRNTAINTACILGALLTAQGCLKDDTLDTNRVPIADAKAVGNNGEVVDATADGGLAALTFMFEGDPIEVTLDAKSSTDLDGKVASYDWRYVAPSSDAGAPASGFWNQSATLDPSNVARPKVLLPMGTHTFTLWVTDNDGAVSVPDTITIKVGGDPMQECLDGAAPELDDTCKQCLCGQEGATGDSCRMAVPGCSGDCWGLIGCIGAMCPTFTMDMDVTCVATNCGAFLGGQTGAMAAGMCIMPCVAECTPSLTEIVTAGGG